MKSRIRITAAKIILAAATMAPAFAHGGFQHIQGTVARVVNNVVTVKTAHGNVDVKLDGRTDVTRNSHRAAVSDLKPGLRVIAEVPEGGKDQAAQSVRIGAATKASRR